MGKFRGATAIVGIGQTPYYKRWHRAGACNRISDAGHRRRLRRLRTITA